MQRGELALKRQSCLPGALEAPSGPGDAVAAPPPPVSSSTVLVGEEAAAAASSQEAGAGPKSRGLVGWKRQLLLCHPSASREGSRGSRGQATAAEEQLKPSKPKLTLPLCCAAAHPCPGISRALCTCSASVVSAKQPLASQPPTEQHR